MYRSFVPHRMTRGALVGILWRPSDYFARLRVEDLLVFATVLQLIRWVFMSSVTMTHFYLSEAPALFPIPFGLDLNSYRHIESYLYFPYGLAIILFISYEVWLHGRKHAGRPMPFVKVWEVVSFAYFAPWLPTAVIDNLLLVFDLAIPSIIVPLHMTVVAAEAVLTAIGLQTVFEIPERRAWALGAWGGVVFLVLAGLLIR